MMSCEKGADGLACAAPDNTESGPLDGTDRTKNRDQEEKG